MYRAWLVFSLMIVIASCDSQSNNSDSIDGLWRHTGTVDGFQSYLQVQDSTMTFYLSRPGEDCFQVGTLFMEKYEDGILTIGTTTKRGVIIPGQESTVIEIGGEIRYELRRDGEMLIYRQLPDGELNEYELSDLDVNELGPTCECSVPELCDLMAGCICNQSEKVDWIIDQARKGK